MIKKLSMIALGGLCLTSSKAIAQESSEPALFDAPASAWRMVDPENLMLIDTAYGQIGVELYPEIAPLHAEQIKTLVRHEIEGEDRNYYDGIIFHRVLKGFMNQTGDPTGTGGGDSHLPNIPAEFTFRRDTTKMPIETFQERDVNPSRPDLGRLGVGFHKALPIATQPSAQSWGTKDGKVEASGIHCRGVTSMARTADPNSANSQFFLMRTKRGTSSESLNTQYSVWGRAVMGVDITDRINVGVNGETVGFQPDKMLRVRMAADLPEDQRPTVKMLKTQGDHYKRFLNTQKKQDGTYRDICDIELPVDIKTP